MRKLLADIPYFLEAAKCSSFTQAANNLEIPLATLSRRIAALEKALGVRLFYRNTRTVSLTEDGEELLESGKFIMGEAYSIKERLQRKQQEPGGPVRVSVEAFVYHCFMDNVFSGFARKYPKIELHTTLSSEWKDLHREPFDLDIRSGPVPYSELKARKVYSIRPALYCSPGLLENHPRPERPKDLIRLPFISQTSESRPVISCSKNGEIQNVTLQARHMVQSIRLGLELALSGQGVALLMPLLAGPFAASGALLPLLEDWKMAELEVHLVMPDRQQPRRVRLFIEHLVEHFQGLPGN